MRNVAILGLLLVIVLAWSGAAAAGDQQKLVRVKILGFDFNNDSFVDGFARDPATLEPDLGYGLCLQLERWSGSYGLVAELSRVEFAADVTEELYGGYFDTIHYRETYWLNRVGLGAHLAFFNSDRTRVYLGAMAYWQDAALISGQEDFGEASAALMLGADVHLGPERSWFLTGDLQVVRLFMDDAGTQDVLQPSLGVGYRF